MRKIVMAFLLASIAGKASDYVGSAACRVCHAAQFELQSKTGHAHALVRTAAGSRGEWAFGAGEKATTWVSQVDHDTYAEHGISHFAATKSDGLTPGHADAKDVFYRTLDPEATTLKCFRCHSTGPLSVNETSGAIQPSEPGVHCEACHGPGSEHVAASGRAGTILNPKGLNGNALNNFCGTCHRKETDSDWTDRWKTRHQPSYLRQAACFRKSGTLSCLTCHDPHAPLNQVGAQYDAKCTGCHKAVSHRVGIASRTCVECHMPQVVIDRRLTFTNHWIGIYSSSSKLVPARSMAQSVPLLASGGSEVIAPNDAITLRSVFEEELRRQPDSARAAFNLGSFLNKNGNPTDAEAPLRRALEIDKTNPEDARLLAQVLSTLGRNDEAVALFQTAAKGDDPEVATEALASLAMLDPAHAEGYYRRALEVSPKNAKRRSTLLNDLAIALEEKKDYLEAEALFRKALALDQAELGSESPATAATLSNFGSLLETMGRHQEAERLEREALQIFERKLGPWSAELATSCTNLADILSTKGDMTQALGLYRRAVAIDESVYGRENPEVAADLVNLGSILKQIGQASEASSTFRRALSIYEQAYGPESPQAKQVQEYLR